MTDTPITVLIELITEKINLDKDPLTPETFLDYLELFLLVEDTQKKRAAESGEEPVAQVLALDKPPEGNICVPNEEVSIPQKSLFDSKYAANTLLNLELGHLEVWKFCIGEGMGVSYQHCEIKDNGMLLSTFGSGLTFEAACEDYLQKISGRTLVFNACGNNRREVTVL